MKICSAAAPGFPMVFYPTAQSSPALFSRVLPAALARIPIQVVRLFPLNR